MSEKVLGFLNQQKTQSRSGLPQHYAAFEDLYDRKLWHQLTQSIHEFIRLGDFREGDELLQLYHNFISDFEKKISPLSLAQFALAASKQMQDRKEAIQFLNSIAEKVDKSVETHVLVVMETAAFQLATGDVAGCKKAIEESEKKLDALSGVEPTIHASFYRVYSSFDQFRGNYDGYYKNSLLYLACVNLDSLNQEEKIERTYNLAIAALLGESIYNFGELLAHEILEVLRGTKYEWLIDLLKVFNTGDIQKFEENRHVLQMDPLLSSSLAFLEQKIRLMGLIEILFKLSGQKRNMYFGDIAQGTKLNEDQVEHLLMKAMSLKLVRGVIDQVSAEVNITWVHPRVLDKAQMESLRAKLASWSEAVSSTVDTMHADSPELFAQ